MPCRCSPCLLTLRKEMDAHRPGWKYLGCCGDEAHRRRKSDHNPDRTGYAHAMDLGESPKVPSMQWLVGQIMGNPDLYPQVKYLIYERSIYYPRDGVRRRGRYAYTGANPHATHLHVSIHNNFTHDTRSWHIAGVEAPKENDDMAAVKLVKTQGNFKNPEAHKVVFRVHDSFKAWVVNEPHANYLGYDLSKVETVPPNASVLTLPTVGARPPGWPESGPPEAA